jgi:hypothetical protein
MTTPEEIERQHTLLTAAARYHELRLRDAGADPAVTAAALTKEESLELLALGEVIARMAGYGRQLAVRTARAAGASWSQIGAALGTSKQSAWEAHALWIDKQIEQYRENGYEGMDEEYAAAVRALADTPDGNGTT